VPTFIALVTEDSKSELVKEDLKLDPTFLPELEGEIKIDLYSSQSSFSYFSPKASSTSAGKVQISLEGLDHDYCSFEIFKN